MTLILYRGAPLRRETRVTYPLNQYNWWANEDETHDLSLNRHAENSLNRPHLTELHILNTLRPRSQSLLLANIWEWNVDDYLPFLTIRRFSNAVETIGIVDLESIGTQQKYEHKGKPAGHPRHVSIYHRQISLVNDRLIEPFWISTEISNSPTVISIEGRWPRALSL